MSSLSRLIGTIALGAVVALATGCTPAPNLEEKISDQGGKDRFPKLQPLDPLLDTGEELDPEEQATIGERADSLLKNAETLAEPVIDDKTKESLSDRQRRLMEKKAEIPTE